MRFLIDTNILIYYLEGQDAAVKFLEQNIDNSCVSFITWIEFLSYDFSEKERMVASNFLSNFERIDIDDEIIEETIKLRTNFRIKLPDCIIAATAMVNNLSIATRNIKDFKSVASLGIFDPFK